jgi:hypothetical protein
MHIGQYLLCSAAQLTSCFSPAATASQLTSSLLPRVNLGASQLLKPASTTPRSYGRRHRSWHYEPQAQTNCCNLRRQHREATAADIGPGPTAMYMQRTTSGAANNSMSTTIIPSCSAAPFKVNSEPHTGALPPWSHGCAGLSLSGLRHACPALLISTNFRWALSLSRMCLCPFNRFYFFLPFVFSLPMLLRTLLSPLVRARAFVCVFFNLIQY